MTIELLQTLSLVSFIAAGVLFLAGLALFFLLDVPRLYGDVSGRIAKKAIEAIRKQNEASGNNAYKPSAVNEARGKLTDRITPSGRLEARADSVPVSVGTEKFATSSLLPGADETALLRDMPKETAVLEEACFNSGETAVLTRTARADEEAPPDGGFAVEVELSFSGSAEIIE